MAWHVVCSCSDFRVFSGLEGTVFALALGSGAVLLLAVLTVMLAQRAPGRAPPLYAAVPTSEVLFFETKRRLPRRD